MTVTITRRAALAATGALAFAPRLAAAAPAIGAPAPDFALPDQDGTLRRLSDFRGKVVVLEWTNHDCPFVRKHYNSANMQGLQRLAADRGVVWLSIASSPVGEQGHVTGAQAKELTASRNAAPAAVLLDHRSVAARAYQATVTPHMFVISADGVLRYMGGIDSIRSTRVDDVARAEPFLRDAMLAVVEGRAVARASTPAYGCAVKYVDA
ncbi:redoxin domain-containing protein [Roseomonas eburnea]|uniref:Redoxin domain-containing protein n=1 Tax=Neoroseomonas eburnea TaxID=1346889 RepID=A0A9X9X8P7_9PROT|nr:redoxin domain-containing protein [Neoroseomonas eburnea]MBR0680083.1 redoxin domain-containing protein [Neoroseomonas eburnea]